jgi:hypothetical protein
MAESGFVEAKNGFICVSCGTSGRARCPSPEREPRARPLDPIDAVAKSRQPLGSQHSHPAGVRQAKFLITMPVFRPQRPAVYPPAEGRHVIVTGVPRGDRIPYLYHPTLPACGQVLSAPPQPAEFDRYKVFAETKPIEAKPPPPLPQPTPEPP